MHDLIRQMAKTNLLSLPIRWNFTLQSRNRRLRYANKIFADNFSGNDSACLSVSRSVLPWKPRKTVDYIIIFFIIARTYAYTQWSIHSCNCSSIYSFIYSLIHSTIHRFLINATHILAETWHCFAFRTIKIFTRRAHFPTIKFEWLWRSSSTPSNPAPWRSAGSHKTNFMVRSFAYSFIHSSIYSFNYSFIHLFIYSFIY